MKNFRLNLKPALAVCGFMLTSLIGLGAQAGFEVEGFLRGADGNLLSSRTVQMWIKVTKDGASNCVLHYEHHNSVQVNAAGSFLVRVGEGTPMAGFSSRPAGLSEFEDYMGYHLPITCRKADDGAADGGIGVVAPSDKRALQITVQAGSDVIDVGSMTLHDVPIAARAKKIGNHSSASLLRVEDGGAASDTTALTPANFTELLALLNGTSTQYSKVTGGKIAPGQVPIVAGTGILIAEVAGQLQVSSTVSVGSGSIDSDKIADDAIATVDLASGSVTADKLAADAVESTKIKNGAVGLSKLASIDSSRILGRASSGNGAVESLEIGTGLSLSGGKLDAVNKGTVQEVKVGSFLNVSNGTSTPEITINVGSGSNDVARGDDARITGALQKGGGTMSGAINMGGNDITASGHIDLSADKHLKLGSFASDPSTAGWGAAQKGRTWFNTVSNQMKYWDGSVIQSVGSGGALVAVDNTASLASANIWVGDASNKAQEVSLGGDLSLNDAGSATLVKIRGIELDSTSPTTTGQVIRYETGSPAKYKADFIRLSDIRSTAGGNPSAFPISCTSNQTLTWNAITDQLACTTLGIYNSQNEKLFFAGPSVGSGTGSPSFRAINPKDLASWTTNASRYLTSSDGTNMTWTDIPTQLTVAGSANGEIQFKNGTSLSASSNFKVNTSLPQMAITSPSNSNDVHLILDSPNGFTKQSIISFKTDGAGNSYVGDTVNDEGWQIFTYGEGHSTVPSSASDFGISYFANNTWLDALRITEAGNVGIGTTTPGAKLDVAGQIRITGGSPGAGKVLQSDANGLASWVMPAAGGEVNTVSNIGNNGIGIYKQKTGVNFELKKINAGSAAISVADDTGNNEIDIDLGTVPRSSVATGTANHVLINDGTGNLGSEAQLAVSRGGTGASSLPSNQLLVGNGTGSVNVVAPGSAGRILRSNGGSAPSWSTATYPDTTTAKQLLYSSGDNTVTGLATLNSAVLVTDGSGVPAWSALSNDTFTQYVVWNGRSGGQTINGGTAASNNLTLDSTSHSTKGNVLLNLSGGNVGIGTSAPRAKLDVAGGAIVGQGVGIAAAPTGGSARIINFANGNLQHTGESCPGPFTLHNLKDGGVYNLVIKGTSVGTCNFTASQTTGSELNVRTPPGHGDTISGKWTLYSFMVVGNDVLVTWIPGY